MSADQPVPISAGTRHLAVHAAALLRLAHELGTIEAWGVELGGILLRGGRLLTAGNGGSAAEAEHLAAELVGRYRLPRVPLSALALTSDSSSLSAIANDFGWRQGLARQVRAHGRQGDVLVALSTSGESANVLEAVQAAREVGMRTWGLTGAAPNPVHGACDEALDIPGPTAVVQEVHLVAIHLLCEAVDAVAVAEAERPLPETG